MAHPTAAENFGVRPSFQPSSSPSPSIRSSSESASSLKSRPTSVYTLSRPSLAEKVAELAAIPQPDRPSLTQAISAFPSSHAAAAALVQSAAEILKWIERATKVLHSLDADGEVSWATASGSEGLEEVDGQISRFGGMISLFVAAVEELQNRADVVDMNHSHLTELVGQVETVVKQWQSVKSMLVQLKAQVEIALEWEELWNTVIGDIALEISNLRRFIFQMEEKRHRTALSAMSEGNGIDLHELETIVEEAPARNRQSGRDSFASSHIKKEESGAPSALTGGPSEDSNLVALFARMQPLRASLDFLPMRLAGFLQRGRAHFPDSCDDLEARRRQLESDWKVLEADAEALRRELGEDQWVLVFRNAGRQAMTMCESVARTVAKLRDGLDFEIGHTAASAATTKAMETYEAKKFHYGAAIERVLSIIDRGVKDRLTVNGEILRLQADVRRRWSELQEEIKAVDFVLRNLDLTDSRVVAAAMAATPISRLPVPSGCIYSTPAVPKPSFSASPQALMATPGSSPASSVVIPYHSGTKSRQSSFNSTSAATTISAQSAYRRPSPARPNSAVRPQTRTVSGLHRKPSQLGTSAHAFSHPSETSKRYSSVSSRGSNTPTTPKSGTKPPWVMSTNSSDYFAGNNPTSKNNCSPSSPSTTALNRKRSLASAKAATISSASKSVQHQASMASLSDIRPALDFNRRSPPKEAAQSPPSRSALPRPRFGASVGPGPVSSMATARSNLASSVPRPNLAPPAARSSLQPPGSQLRPRSSMALAQSATRPVSRVVGASSSMGVRNGVRTGDPNQSMSARTNSVTRDGISASPPSRTLQPVTSSATNSRINRGPPSTPSAGMAKISARAVFSASTSAAAVSNPPMTRYPRRQSSAARLVTSPSSNAGASRIAVLTTPRAANTAAPASRIAVPARPSSVMMGRPNRMSFLPQPTPSKTTSGTNPSRANTPLASGRMSRNM